MTIQSNVRAKDNHLQGTNKRDKNVKRAIIILLKEEKFLYIANIIIAAKHYQSIRLLDEAVY